MHELLNTLYVLTDGAVLHLDSDTVRVAVDGETILRVPLLRLDGIVVVGRVTVTPFLIARCAADGRGLVWLDRRGRFAARAEGPMRGNVMLRRAQHLALSDAERPWRIARQIVAGKVQNSRAQIMRAARDTSEPDSRRTLREAAEQLAEGLRRLRDGTDLDVIRGEEGHAARIYFGVFTHMIRGDKRVFGFDHRTRRRRATLLTRCFHFSTHCCRPSAPGQPRAWGWTRRSDICTDCGLAAPRWHWM